MFGADKCRADKSRLEPATLTYGPIRRFDIGRGLLSTLSANNIAVSCVPHAEVSIYPIGSRYVAQIRNDVRIANSDLSEKRRYVRIASIYGDEDVEGAMCARVKHVDALVAPRCFSHMLPHYYLWPGHGASGFVVWCTQ